MDALKLAIAICGSQSELARRLGVTQTHVWNWINRSHGKIPSEYAIPIETATEGAVTRHQLRPDLYPLDEPKPVPVAP